MNVTIHSYEQQEPSARCPLPCAQTLLQGNSSIDCLETMKGGAKTKIVRNRAIETGAYAA